jgi:hypothetical protein
MDILGALHVNKELKDSPFEIFNSLETLTTGLTKIGAIAYFNNFLYYRDSTGIRKVVNVQTLSQELLTLSQGGDTFITNVSNSLISDTTFLTNLSNSVTFIGNLLNNTTFIGNVKNIIASSLNVKVTSLSGTTLFYAFTPEDIIIPVVEPPPITPPSSCTIPTSINVEGNMTPLLGSTESYTLSKIEGANSISIFNVIGGTIVGDKYSSSIQVVWEAEFSGLASITASAGCEDYSAIFDYNFFLLVGEIEPPVVTGIEIILSFDAVSEINAADKFANEEFSSYYSIGSGLQINSSLYTTSELITKVATGYYAKGVHVHTVVNGNVTAINKVV